MFALDLLLLNRGLDAQVYPVQSGLVGEDEGLLLAECQHGDGETSIRWFNGSEFDGLLGVRV